MAVMLPRSWNGGASEKFMLRKPTIVVTLVITTGTKLILTLSIIAVRLSAPSRMRRSIVTRMCTLSAIARVMMIVGATTEIGVSLMPIQPAIPNAEIADSTTTNRVEATPVKLRSTTIMNTMSTRNISGIRVAASYSPASENALFSIETPVSATSICGYSCSTRSASSRAKPTAAGTSVRSCSGYWSVTIDAGSGHVASDQVAGEQRLGHGDLSLVVQLGLFHAPAVTDQVGNGQIISYRLAVLEIAQRIHADRVGDLPGLFGQLLDRVGDFGGEHVPPLRFQHEQNVVVLGVGRLKVFEGEQLRVLFAEEHPVVVGELEIASAGGGTQCDQ